MSCQSNTLISSHLTKIADLSKLIFNVKIEGNKHICIFKIFTKIKTVHFQTNFKHFLLHVYQFETNCTF